MDKRYQVFVSSTFKDLEQERTGIMRTLMELDCIPAGMELFPAADEEQRAFIQKVIDDSDYYLLIIGGRYGSVTAEGVSYTEQEYDYAVSKSVHVIALLHGDPEQIPVAKSETDELARKRLDSFRKKVSTGRLVKFWKSPPELLQQVVLSLTHAFKAHPRQGWVRGGTTPNSTLLEQINELRQRNEELQEHLADAVVTKPIIKDLDLADADSVFLLYGTYTAKNLRLRWTANLTWNQIIAVIGPHMLSPLADVSSSSVLAKAACAFNGGNAGMNAFTDLNCLATVKIQLLALGYIDVLGGSWTLTELGKQMMFRTRTVKAT